MKRSAEIVERSIAHPFSPGKRLKLKGPRDRTEAQIARIREVKKDVELGLRPARDLDRMLIRAEHGPITFGQLVDRYLKQPHLTINTRRFVEWARSNQYVDLEKRPVEAMSAEFMSTWIGERMEEVSASTVPALWSYVHAIVSFGAIARLIDSIPWEPWKPKLYAGAVQREAARSVAELVTILRTADEFDHARRSHIQRGRTVSNDVYSCMLAALSTMTMLGLRAGELAALGWDDFAPGLVRATIRHQAIKNWRKERPDWKRPQFPVKGKRAVTLTLPALLILILERHRDYLMERELYRDDGPVFPSPNGYGAVWLTQPVVFTGATLRQITERAGFGSRGWVPHSMRHTYCTLEAQASGGDLVALRARTRTRNVATLLMYLHEARDGRVMPRAIYNLPLSLFDADAPELVSDADANARALPSAEPSPQNTNDAEGRHSRATADHEFGHVTTSVAGEQCTPAAADKPIRID